MIWMLLGTAWAACVAPPVYVFPPDGATDLPRNASVRVTADPWCTPEDIIVEIDGVPVPPERGRLHGGLLFVTRPDVLEPGEHQLMVRAEPPVWRVWSTFEVGSDVDRTVPAEPSVIELDASWFEGADGLFHVGVLGRVRVEASSSPDDVVFVTSAPPVDGASFRPPRAPGLENPDQAFYGGGPGRAEPPAQGEEVCVDVSWLQDSSIPGVTRACAPIVELDQGRGCSSLGVRGGLWLVLGGLFGLRRRRGA